MLWLNKMVLGNTMLRWVLAGGGALGLSALARLGQRWLAPRLAARAARTGALTDLCLADLLARTHLLFVPACALALGGQLLELPPGPARCLDLLPRLALLLQLAAWGHRAISLWVDRRFLGDQGARASRAAVLAFILRLALGSLLLLLALDAMGFNVNTLLASLGIGGIAVALALQNILGDLFASLSIALDEPFVIGDFIKVGESLGTVQFIGLKTTRLASLSGEQIIIANSDLLKSRIQNFKRMKERRVLFEFVIRHRTPAERVRRIPGTLQRIIEALPTVRFDRAHFKAFSESGLRFEVVYYVLDPDYNLYMDRQQAINLEILDAFREGNISFSFPGRSLLCHPE
jgi:small-conductance mechanosensitive channel